MTISIMDDVNNIETDLNVEIASLRQQIVDLTRSAREHTQIEQSLKQQNRELAILNRLNQAISGESALDEVATVALQTLGPALDLDQALFFIRKHNQLHLLESYADYQAFTDDKNPIPRA